MLVLFLIAWVACFQLFWFDDILLGGDITRKKKLLKKQVPYFNFLFSTVK